MQENHVVFRNGDHGQKEVLDDGPGSPANEMKPAVAYNFPNAATLLLATRLDKSEDERSVL